MGNYTIFAMFENPRTGGQARNFTTNVKNHPLDVAEKYVETYSPSNAAARDPEERVRLINIQKIQYKINSLIQKLQKKKKIERTRRLTDLEWPKSPAQSLHIPSTSHNNPRTSQSCRQNNTFLLIYSNVRNYSFRKLTLGADGLGVSEMYRPMTAFQIHASCIKTSISLVFLWPKQPIAGFHSRDQQPCFSTKTKGSVCIIIELNSRRIWSGHQHGRLFFF